jgi:hypothetical protein
VRDQVHDRGLLRSGDDDARSALCSRSVATASIHSRCGSIEDGAVTAAPRRAASARAKSATSLGRSAASRRTRTADRGRALPRPGGSSPTFRRRPGVRQQSRA